MTITGQAGPDDDPVDVRASYLRFPSWTQHFWTWATGKALPGQQPLLRLTWRSYLALTVGGFFGGLALSSVALADMFTCWYLAVVAGVFVTLAAARSMILVTIHQCIHKRFTGGTQLDRLVGQSLTVLNIWQDFGRMKQEHFDNHHREGVFATAADPPVQSLLRLGFKPGADKRRLWHQTFLVFFTPKLYVVSLCDRLRYNVITGGWRRVAFAAWFGFWLSTPFWVHNGVAILLVAFVLPVLLLNQASAILDRLGEHAWLTPADPALGRRYYHVPATWARFCGRPVPPAGLPLTRRVVEWSRWAAATVCYHLPARLLVLSGDLPNHDFHHRFPGTWEWATAAYARQRDIDGSGPDTPPYTEVWGMGQAIDHMFAGLSEVRELATVDH